MFLALLLILVFYFNPRPPRGERLGDKVPVIVKAKISIHALREESDLSGRIDAQASDIISIHALREESDPCGCFPAVPQDGFQSTPSARRATAKAAKKSNAFVPLYTLVHNLKRNFTKAPAK